MQTIFQGVPEQTELIVHSLSSLQAFVFVENQKMLDIVNGEELGSLEEANRTKPSESLAEGEGLKEGNVGRKAQFNLITRNAKRKQGYDKRDRVTVEMRDEQGKKCRIEGHIYSNRDGIYNITYYPKRQGTLKFYVRINGEDIRGSPYTVIVKPFHIKPYSSFGQQGSGEGMFLQPTQIAVSDRDEIVRNSSSRLL